MFVLLPSLLRGSEWGNGLQMVCGDTSAIDAKILFTTQNIFTTNILVILTRFSQYLSHIFSDINIYPCLKYFHSILVIIS